MDIWFATLSPDTVADFLSSAVWNCLFLATAGTARQFVASASVGEYQVKKADENC